MKDRNSIDIDHMWSSKVDFYRENKPMNLHFKFAAKALTYRIAGSLVTAAIAYGFTHRPGISIGVGATDFVSKIALYYGHEWAWHKLSGPK